MNNISESFCNLNLIGNVILQALDNEIKYPLEIFKIQMNKLENKEKIMSSFYNVCVDFREADFNLYIIKDTDPVYDYRITSKGNFCRVNTNLFDLKTALRKKQEVVR